MRGEWSPCYDCLFPLIRYLYGCEEGCHGGDCWRSGFEELCVVSLGFVSCWCSCDVVGPPTAEENTGTAEKELIACVRRKN